MPQFDDKRFNERLAEMRRKGEEDFLASLAEKYGQRHINLQGVSIDPETLGLINEQVARAAEVAAFKKDGKKISVAMRNPNKKETRDVLADLAAREFTVIPYMVSTASLEHAWARYGDLVKTTAALRGTLSISSERVEDIGKTSGTVAKVGEEIQRLSADPHTLEASHILEVILGSAMALDASDVHIEPEANAVRLRFRLDGILTDVTDISTELYRLLSSRLKVLAGLKLNKPKDAQDGRFSIAARGTELDIRSSVIPGAFGESFVMRLLDPGAALQDIKELGLNPIIGTVIEEELRRPQGMIVTTGPTGSGKTTALYAFLRHIHTPDIKIVTLEDPIEYKLDDIVQTQVTDTYTFASGLRSVLRQDPDVILVGEIRDRDVAETAVHAALTGHLVFSTLHTNSAAGAFARLIDLGVDPKIVESAISLVLGERLVRRLCTTCKKARAATSEEQELLRTMLDGVPNTPSVGPDTVVHDSVGCDACNGTGFKGRIGLFEGIRVDRAVSETVLSDTREFVIRQAAKPQGIPTLAGDGAIKVLEGTTSLAEVQRVVDITDYVDQTTQKAAE